MVNFSAYMAHQSQSLVTEPRQLFQTLQRDPQHQYLRAVQSDVLNEWYTRRDQRDVVIKMNTGSGKTLVGLVLLWSRLQERKGPALYLCPDTYLVSQVRREADALGIRHVDFDQNNQFPPEFFEQTGILVTTIHKLFNGYSVFRVANRSNPVPVGTVLVDDAHACINIARDQFTATFARQSDVAKRIWSMFEPALREQAIGISAEIEQERFDAYLRVPYWTWQQRLPDVTKLLSEYNGELAANNSTKKSDDGDFRFVWPFLRGGQVLANSTAVISGSRIEITPHLLPIELVPSTASGYF